MTLSQNGRIHATAIIAPEAELADDVEVGPYVVIEGKVRIGPGCVIRPHVHLIGDLTLGKDNLVGTGCVLGERPQHIKYQGEPTRVEIGDGNIFREHVTIHRGTTHSWVTRLGSGNFLMANSHVGHDCLVGNDCIIANGALVAGHCILDDKVFLSGNSAVHQFVRIGRLALISGNSATSKDIPPFLIVQGLNWISGINVVGMRRAGMSHEQINGIRRAFHILFLEGNVLPVALAKVEKELSANDAALELVQFIRGSERGILFRADKRRAEAA